MIKIKGILPSLREQNRYILLEVMCGSRLDYHTVKEAVLESCKYYMGAVGFAEAGPMFIKNRWDDEKQQAVLKVNRKYVDWAKAAFAMITRINAKEATVRSKTVSGILKKAS